MNRVCLLMALMLMLTAGRVQAATGGLALNDTLPKPKFLSGIAVQGDFVGFGMKLAGGRFANMEVGCRLNLMEKYFPIVELGVGDCTHEGRETSSIFSTTAPYFRIGADYCFTKKRNGNRLLAGLRYGYSSYKYDFQTEDLQDPIWPNTNTEAGQLTDMDGRNHWAEVVVGVETKLWRFIRLGWNMRYKMRIHQKASPKGEPWYVPGFGRNDGNCWGGAVNLIFEL